MLDFGFPQITSTEVLKTYVHNEAVPVTQPTTTSAAVSVLNAMTSRSKPSNSSNAPIALGANKANAKNEVLIKYMQNPQIFFDSYFFFYCKNCNYQY